MTLELSNMPRAGKLIDSGFLLHPLYQVTPYFMVAIFLEMAINAFTGHEKKVLRWNDAMSSVAQGFFSQLPKYVSLTNLEAKGSDCILKWLIVV
jgi:hypothetical protein